MPFQSLGQEDTLKEGMAAHSCVLAWRIPWTEESGGLQSMGWQRVGKDFADIAYKPMPSFRTVPSHLEKMSCCYSTYLSSTSYLDQSTQHVPTLSLSNQRTSCGLKWSSVAFTLGAIFPFPCPINKGFSALHQALLSKELLAQDVNSFGMEKK